VRRHDAVEMPVDASLRPLTDLRRTIAALVSLQAAARDGAPAVNAFLTGLASPDPEVKLWAAHHGYLRITDPPAELVNAYLALWSSGDAEILAATANAVIAWRVRRAGPMMAAALREGSEAERANAARALGGAGDLSFLPQLRTSARSDSATIVRSSAYQGLALLLGGESLNDLDRGARDPQPLVRRIVAASAANVGRNSTDPTLRARVRRLLTLLGEDRSAEVRVSAQYAMRLLADPAPNRTAR
jgi:HEAT repeat protein